MQGLPRFEDPNLLIGADLFSDAGVYRVAPDLAIVQSLDFFPPLVDDEYIFGRIAAANALSDLYAMGATPRTALNIVGFPDNELDMSVLAEILRGGSEQVLDAGAVVLGGHSVRDAEIKYGLSVTGTVDPSRMMSNRGARPGDLLVLTKSLGTGFITTAIRKDTCDEQTIEHALQSMSALNDVASRAAMEHAATACTDITGFGLAGHAYEMAEASGVTLNLNTTALPLLPGAHLLAEQRLFTRANATNRAHVAPSMQIDPGTDELLAEFLFDPQTSGGLLISLSADRADALVASLRSAGVEAAAVIGSVEPRGEVALRVH